MAIGEHKNHMALEKDLKFQGVLNINTFFKSHYPIHLDQDYGWLFLFFSRGRSIGPPQHLPHKLFLSID